MNTDPGAFVIAILYIIMVGVTFHMMRKGKW